MTRNTKYYVRILVSVSLLAYLISMIELKEIAGTLSRVAPLTLLAAFLLILGDLLLNVRLIQMLASVKARHLPFRTFLKVYLVSSFWGTFLPSSFGTDMAMTYGLSRAILSLRDALSSIFVLRVFTSLPHFVFAICGALFIKFRLDPTLPVFLPVVVLSAAYLLFFTVVTNRPLLELCLGITKWFQRFSISDILLRFKESYLEFCETGIRLRLLIISFLAKALAILAVFLVARSLRIDVQFVYFVAFVPVVTVLTMLPISVGGLGVRELSFVHLFSYASLSSEEAAGLSLMLFSLLLLISLLGGILLVREYFLSREAERA